MVLLHFYCVKTLSPGIPEDLFHVFRFAKSREIGGQRWERRSDVSVIDTGIFRTKI